MIGIIRYLLVWYQCEKYSHSWLSYFNILLVNAVVTIVSAQQSLTLKIQNPPGLCVGGEVCLLQPAVTVVNSVTGQVVTDYIGSAYVVMGQSASGNEPLYIGACNYNGCGARVVGSSASVVFKNGLAQFKVT